jgi:hypothetical protein
LEEDFTPMNTKSDPGDFVGGQANSGTTPEVNFLLTNRTASLQPLISCIMLVDDIHRIEDVESACRSFLLQNWQHRELVILSRSSYGLVLPPSQPPFNFQLPARFAREIVVPPNLSLVDVVNLGIEASAGEFYTFWHPDEFNHPDWLSELMRNGHQPGIAIRASTQLRYWFPGNSAFTHRSPNGVGCGSPLFARTADRVSVFNAGEDLRQLTERFFEECWTDRATVLDTTRQTHFNIRMLFSRHKADAKKFAEPRYENVWLQDQSTQEWLSYSQAAHLRRTLKRQYHFDPEFKPWPDDVEEKLKQKASV